MTLRLIYIVFALLFSSSAFTQEKIKLLLANDYFNKYSYMEAAPIYEDLAVKNPGNLIYLIKTAESYRLTGNTVKAEEYYGKIVNSGKADLSEILKYAEMLQENKKYDDAQKYFMLYNEKNGEDSRAKRKITNERASLYKDSTYYKVTNLPYNSPFSDFGLFPFKSNTFLFSSNRKTEKERYINHTYNWNNQPFLDLYVMGDQFQSPQPFSVGLNSKLHEGPVFYDEKSNSIYLTRNNINDKKTEKSKDGVNKLKIFISDADSLGFKKLIEFPYNSNEYSVGHATLSSDGSKLYFSSDMPNGVGGADIYVSLKTSEGWGKPINMGSIINTEGNEVFPFIDDKNKLYFSSDGHYGLGGLDIYSVELNKDEIAGFKNLGYPINSNKDDFSFFATSDYKSGYFSSNRDGGNGGDDIYAFELLKPINKMIKGVAKDQHGNVVPNALIVLQNEFIEEIASVVSEPDGSFSFMADVEMKYLIRGLKPSYNDGLVFVSTATENPLVIVDLTLEKEPAFSLYGLITDDKTKEPIEGVEIKLTNNETGDENMYVTKSSGNFSKTLIDNKLNDEINYTLELKKTGYISKVFYYKQKLNKEDQYNVHESLDLSIHHISVGDDLAKLMGIKSIYFDLGKYNIREDAAAELEKIIQVMNENPSMEIELRSHTDCRASISSNQKLSENRAQESAKYIKKRITNPERIQGKGYGESRLVNDCPCEGQKSKCSEEEHQQNRRTEFIITKL